MKKQQSDQFGSEEIFAKPVNFESLKTEIADLLTTK